MWSEDVLVTTKVACRLEAFNHYLACSSSPVCIAEFFANLLNLAPLGFEWSYISISW